MHMAQLSSAQQLPTGPRLDPPRTIGAAVRQARDAFRRFRDATASERVVTTTTTVTAASPASNTTTGTAPPLPPPPRRRLMLQLPLPVASASPPGVPLLELPIWVPDEGDWPGGMRQRFRALRPVVDATLDGYGASFLGMLEDPADGLGCWSLAGATLAAIPCNATYSSFAKLAAGGYGEAPLQPGHVLLAVNAEWTGPGDIGQPWQRELKRSAAELLDPATWETLYSVRMLRTSRGRACGLLVGAYGSGWHLWLADSEDSSSVREGPCLLWAQEEPTQAQLVATLNEAAQAGAKPRRGWFG